MTRIVKSVRRETAAESRKRPLVVEAHPGFLALWEKGCPTTRVSVSYLAIYQLGCKMQAGAK